MARAMWLEECIFSVANASAGVANQALSVPLQRTTSRRPISRPFG